MEKKFHGRLIHKKLNKHGEDSLCNFTLACVDQTRSFQAKNDDAHKLIHELRINHGYIVTAEKSNDVIQYVSSSQVQLTRNLENLPQMQFNFFRTNFLKERYYDIQQKMNIQILDTIGIIDANCFSDEDSKISEIKCIRVLNYYTKTGFHETLVEMPLDMMEEVRQLKKPCICVITNTTKVTSDLLRPCPVLSQFVVNPFWLDIFEEMCNFKGKDLLNSLILRPNCFYQASWFASKWKDILFKISYIGIIDVPSAHLTLNCALCKDPVATKTDLMQCQNCGVMESSESITLSAWVVLSDGNSTQDVILRDGIFKSLLASNGWDTSCSFRSILKIFKRLKSVLLEVKLKYQLRCSYSNIVRGVAEIINATVLHK